MTLTDDPALDVDAWLEENWDPDLTVAEWWTRLADARLAHPMLPRRGGGTGRGTRPLSWSGRWSGAKPSDRRPGSG